MGEDKRGSEDGAGYMRVTESCSLLLEGGLCRGVRWARSSVWHLEHHLTAEASGEGGRADRRWQRHSKPQVLINMD